MQGLCLVPLEADSARQFHQGVKAAFAVAARKEFGASDGDVISDEEIDSSLNAPGAASYAVVLNGEEAGGVVVQIDRTSRHNSLDLLYVHEAFHGRGIGTAVWRMIEEMYPDTEVWETHTPYFEKRNIHFYVNKCGFHIVEFFNPQHPDPHAPSADAGGEYFFRFEKRMRC